MAFDLDDTGLPFDRLLDIREIAAGLSLHPTTVRRWADAGEFPKPLIFKGMIRWRAIDVQNWINSPGRQEGSAPEIGAAAAPAGGAGGDRGKATGFTMDRILGLKPARGRPKVNKNKALQR